MTNLVPLEIVQYCAEEVERQRDTPVAVGRMCEAWMWAVERWFHGKGDALEYLRPPRGVETIVRIGAMVHPANVHGFRKVPVLAGGNPCPEPVLVPRMVENLVEAFSTLSPEDAYREYQQIHPFVDGNGRSGKIIFNWLKGTLMSPVMPPNFFNVP